MTLGYVETQEKYNEITAIPDLLQYLDIKGATVTIDVVGCQHEIVKRIVTKNRADYAIALKSWFADLAKWNNLQALLMVKSIRQVIGKEPTTETRYYITSLASVKDAATAVRTNWRVENNLHLVLDAVFKEDDWKTKNATAATNLTAIRRFTNNLLKAHPDPSTSPTKRYMRFLNLDFLYSVVANPALFT